MKDFKSHSRIIQGLMRLDNVNDEQLYDLIMFDLDHGIDTFDLADIYGGGDSERKFGQVMIKHPELRQRIFVQSKCGIVIKPDGTYYDLSYDYIVNAVKSSLKRCHLDYFDSYLLHRPDIMMDAYEVYRAMKDLSDAGLVKNFGVSNFSTNAIKYLMHAGVNVSVNQMQLGLGHLDMVRENLNTNLNNEAGVQHSADLFFFLKDKNIELQCWSPYQYGFFEGSFFSKATMKETNGLLDILGMKYKESKCTIATAFLLQLGKNVSVITGSTNKIHVLQAIDAIKVELSKQEWYQLYCSTGNKLP